MKPYLLAFVEKHQIRVLVEQIANDKGLNTYYATAGEQILQFVKTLAPFMMLVDLTGSNTQWLFKHISDIKHLKPDFPIVPIVPAGEEAVKHRLHGAGCKSVFTTKEVQKKLPVVVDDILKMRFE